MRNVKQQSRELQEVIAEGCDISQLLRGENPFLFDDAEQQLAHCVSLCNLGEK